MSRISGKNQITIPGEVLRAAGLGPGDEVRVKSVGPGHVEFVRVDALVEHYAGSLDEDIFPPGYLESVREGWR